MHSDKTGRPSFKVREEVAAESLWAEDPSLFVYRRQANRLRNDNVFNRSAQKHYKKPEHILKM